MADLSISVELQGMQQALASLGALEKSVAAIGTSTPGMSSLEQSFSRGMSSAENFSRSIESLGFRITAGVSAPLIAMGTSIVQAGAQWDRMTAQMTVATGSSEAAAREIQFITGVADDLGVGLGESGTQFAKFAIAARAGGANMETVRGTFIAVSEASATLGLSSSETGRIFSAMSQMFSKGKVSMEELRQQLGERLVGAMDLAAKASGLTVEEFSKMVATGKVMTKDFFPAFIAQIHAAFGGSAQAAAQTFTANMNRMQNAILEMQVAIGNAGLMQAVTNVMKGITFLAQGVATMDPMFQRAVVAVGAFVAILGPVVMYTGLVTTSLLALGGPLAAVALGLAGAVAVAGAFGDKIAANVVPAIQDAIQTFDSWSGTAEDLGHILGNMVGTVVTWGLEFSRSVADGAAAAGAALIQGVSTWDIGATLMSVLGALADFGRAFLDAVVGTVREAGLGLNGEISGWDIAQALATVILPVASWGVQFIAAVATTADETGRSLVDQVSAWDIAAGLNELLADVAAWGAPFLDGIVATATEAGNGLIAEVQGWDIAAGLSALLDAVAAWGGPFLEGIVATAAEAGLGLIAEVQSWDIGSGLAALLDAVATWGGDLLAALGATAAEAGQALIDGMASWDVGSGLSTVLDAVAVWGTDFMGGLAAIAIEAGLALLDEIQTWDIGSALGELLVGIGEFGVQFQEGIVGTMLEVGLSVAQAIQDWGPDVAGAMGYLSGVLVGAVFELGGYVIGEFVAMASSILDAFSDAMAQEDWSGTFLKIGEYAYDALFSLIDLAIETALAFGQGFIDGVKEALTPQAVTDAVSGVEQGLVTVQGWWDSAVTSAQAFGSNLVSGVQSSMAGMVPAMTGGVQEGATEVKSLADSLYDYLVGHSTFPDIRDETARVFGQFPMVMGQPMQQAANDVKAIADGMQVDLAGTWTGFVAAAVPELDRLVAEMGAAAAKGKASMTGEFSDLAIKVSAEVGRIASTIANSDLGLPQKVQQFNELEAVIARFGDSGTLAFQKLQKAIGDWATRAASDITRSNDGFTVQAAKLRELEASLVSMGAKGSVGLQNVAEAASKLGETFANTRIREILQDWSLSYEQQAAQLRTLGQTIQQELGVNGAEGVRKVNEELQKLAAQEATQRLKESLGDLELSLSSQAAKIREQIPYWQSLGAEGALAVKKLQGELKIVEQDLANSRSWFLGIQEGVQAAIGDFTDFRTIAGGTVKTMFTDLQGGMKQWILTGKLDLAGLKTYFLEIFADIASKVVTGYLAQIAEGFLGIPRNAQTAGQGVATAMTGSAQQGTVAYQGMQTAVGTAFTGIRTAAVTALGSLGDAAQAAVTGIRGYFAGLPAAIGGVWSQIQQAAGGMFQALSTAVSGWVASARNLFAGLPATLGGVWQSIQAGAQAMFGALSSAVTGWVGIARNLFAGLPAQLGGVWQQIQAGAQAMFGALSTAVTGWVGAARNLFSALPAQLGGVWQQIQAGAQAMFGALSTAVTGWVGTARNLFAALPAQLGGVWTQIQAGAQAMFGALSTAVTGWVGTARNLFAALPAQLGGVWTQIQAGAQGMFGALSTAVTGWVGTARNLFASLPPQLGAVWAQIQAGAQAMFAALSGAVTGWVGTARTLFGGLPPLLAGVWQSIQAGAAAMFGQLSAGVTGWIGTARTLFAGLVPAVQGTWSSIMGGATALFGQLNAGVTGFVNAARALFAGLVPSIQANWGSITGGATAMFGQLSAGTSGFIASARSLFAGLVPSIQANWSAITQGASAMFASIGTAMAGWLANARAAFSTATTTAQGMWSTIQQLGSSMFASITSLMSSWLGSARSSFSTFQSTGQSTFSSVLSLGQNLFSSLGSALSNFISQAGGLWKTFSSLAAGAFSSVQGGFGGLVSRIVSGAGSISGGFGSAVGSVVNGISSIGSVIASYFHEGGVVGGKRGSDRVSAWLTPGEFVVNREAAAQYRGLLERINEGNGSSGGLHGGSGAGTGYGQQAFAGFFGGGVGAIAGGALGGALASMAGGAPQAIGQAAMVGTKLGEYAGSGLAQRGFAAYDARNFATTRTQAELEQMRAEEMAQKIGQLGINPIGEIQKARTAQATIERMDAFTGIAKTAAGILGAAAGTFFGPGAAFAVRMFTPVAVEAAARLAESWPEVREKIASWFQSNSIMATISSAWGKMVQWAQGAWGAAKGAIGSIWNGITSAASSAWSGITGAAGSLGSFASSVWNGITSVASSVRNAFTGGGVGAGTGGSTGGGGYGGPNNPGGGSGGTTTGPGGTRGGGTHGGGMIQLGGIYKLLESEAVFTGKVARQLGPSLEGLNRSMGSAIGGYSSANMDVGPGEYLTRLERGTFVLNPAASDYLGLTPKRRATGADAVVSRPTVFLAGEGGSPERVQITPGARGARRGGDGTTMVFNGPVISNDLTMNQFLRRLTREAGRSRDPRAKG